MFNDYDAPPQDNTISSVQFTKEKPYRFVEVTIEIYSTADFEYTKQILSGIGALIQSEDKSAQTIILWIDSNKVNSLESIFGITIVKRENSPSNVTIKRNFLSGISLATGSYITGYQYDRIYHT